MRISRFAAVVALAALAGLLGGARAQALDINEDKFLPDG